jgi:hypothetical protein
VAGGEAAPDNATVQLDAATHLALKGMSHTTAGQMLTGGAGHGEVVGLSGGDPLRDTVAGLNGASIASFIAGDRIGLTDLGFPGAGPVCDATSGTLHVTRTSWSAADCRRTPSTWAMAAAARRWCNSGTGDAAPPNRPPASSPAHPPEASNGDGGRTWTNKGMGSVAAVA